MEVLAPLLERAAGAPHVLDDGAEPPVAAADEALGDAGPRVVPLDLHALGLAGGVAQQVHLAVQLDLGVLAEPLERRERLGHEAADAHGDRAVVAVGLGQLDAAAGQLGDAEGVLVGLGGEAGEEVELHPPPALAEGRVDRGVEVLLGDQLVDDLAHPPRAGLGGEGEAGAAGLLDLGGDADGEGVDPQARQAHRHVAAADRVVHGGGDDVLDAGEVGGGQAA